MDKTDLEGVAVRLFQGLDYCFRGRDQRLFCAQFIFFLLLLGGALSLWSSLRPSIEQLDVYRIDPEKDVYVWNQPEWIEEDLVAESLKRLPKKDQKREYCALDRTLADTFLRAFSSHPWVDKVESVVVSYPARVDVVLDFKEPIARVDASTVEETRFLNFLAERFPEDEEVKRLVFENTPDPSAAVERVRTDLTIDAQGRLLTTDYFCAHEEECELPIVCTYGPYHELLNRAGALVELLKETGADKANQVDKIHLLKLNGETEPIFFITTKDERVAKWGTFAREKGDFAEPVRDKEEERRALFDAQKKKLDAWTPELESVDLSQIIKPRRAER